MGNWFSFEWVFISWIISLFIHYKNIKRNSISDKISELIQLISELSECGWCKSDSDFFYNEERYNAKLSRIRWKVIQLNRLATCTIINVEKLKPLYDFDIETYVNEHSKLVTKRHPKLKSRIRDTESKTKRELTFKLEDNCASLIEHIEERHFKKVLRSKSFMLWSLRFTLGGCLIGFVIVYLFIQIMSFFYGS